MRGSGSQRSAIYIGTEELSHLEVVGTLARMHLKPAKFDRQAAGADPLIAIAGGGGVNLFNSHGNAWTAANVRLEVFGSLQPSRIQSPSGPQAAALINQVVYFTNHYDGSSQPTAIQIPDGYTGSSPVPLVVYAHTRYGKMEEGIDELGAAANAKGWLLGSPQLHGHWPFPPDPPGAFAYASLESQYDVIGTVQYMLNHYNVDRHRIYLVGYSMGAQISTVTGAKYPDIFAAIFDDKGPTDFADWYSQQSALSGHSQQVNAMKQECYTGSPSSPAPQSPSGNLFCYHRRSSDELEPNLIHTPISMTHSFAVVPPMSNDIRSPKPALLP